MVSRRVDGFRSIRLGTRDTLTYFIPPFTMVMEAYLLATAALQPLASCPVKDN